MYGRVTGSQYPLGRSLIHKVRIIFIISDSCLGVKKKLYFLLDPYTIHSLSFRVKFLFTDTLPQKVSVNRIKLTN